MKEFWNSRYQEEQYAYGQEPNQFFKAELLKLNPGKALFPAEGEGRNSIFAAKLGWEVTAFDLSEAGREKALKLCYKEGVSIDYRVSTLDEFESEPESFEVLVLIFAHFPSAKRKEYHQKLFSFLKPGGILILEGFSKFHLKFNSVNELAGGPKDPAMLFSKEELLEDFEGSEIIKLEENEKVLAEGLYHQGQSAVIEFLARKK